MTTAFDSVEVLSRVSLALSLFLTFLLLWLGVTTLLAARGKRAFARAAAAALLLASAFFLSHAMIVGKGPTTSGSGMEFWWRLGWLPAVSAPLSWYATVIRYAGMTPRQQALHRRIWWGFLLVGLAIVTLLVIDNPFANYRALLFSSPSAVAGRTAPLVWLYLGLNVAGFSLPVLALLSGRREGVSLIRAQARPWLIGTGLALLSASVIVAVTAIWMVGRALPLLRQQAGVVAPLLRADILTLGLISAATVLLGRAVVAYEVFTERPLPRQGFFRRWRSVVVTALGCSGLVAALLALEVRPLYSLVALSLLGISAYALFTWQTYRAHEVFLSRLLPFVTSMDLAERLLRAEPTAGFGSQAEALLRALCVDALGTGEADLVLPGESPRRVSYRRRSQEPDPPPIDPAGLRLALTGGRGAGGELVLGRKLDGREYVTEEVELARACGERLLDTLAGEQIAELLMELLRARLGELQVIGARHKRVLHDEVLPDIHAALLTLQAGESAGRPVTVQALSRAHRTISGLLQAGPRSVAAEIQARGLVGALREAVRAEFADAFESIAWEVEPEAERRLMEVRSQVAGEVVYFAALEAVRNAARHAAGGSVDRKVRLRIAARWEEGLALTVGDDGVGLASPANRFGGGEGLLLHSTMMAVVGGSLSVRPAESGIGTVARLWLPAVGLFPAVEIAREGSAGDQPASPTRTSPIP